MTIPEHLISTLYQQLKFTEPESYTSIRDAITYLSRFTGMSCEQISQQIGHADSYVNMLRSRNKSIPSGVCLAFKQLCDDYNIPRLSQWFEQRYRIETHKQRGVRAGKRSYE